MKNFKIIYLLLIVFLFFGCSSNDSTLSTVEETIENLNDQPIDNQPPTETSNYQEDAQIPMESLVAIGAVALEGNPKMIKKFENGTLKYWAQYYFRPDGNILKINYGYSSFNSEKYSYIYNYDIAGRIESMIGWDMFNFHWENDRIIKVEGNNVAWHGRYGIFYDYNDQGQIIQKLEIYLDTATITYLKTNYSYFGNGNLKSIEGYVDSNGKDTFELYSKTDFGNYIESRNLFMDLEIIPGQSEMFQFPGTKEFKHFPSSGYDYFETYEYKYDADGRVIEQRFGNNKTVYEYY